MWSSRKRFWHPRYCRSLADAPKYMIRPWKPQRQSRIRNSLGPNSSPFANTMLFSPNFAMLSHNVIKSEFGWCWAIVLLLVVCHCFQTHAYFPFQMFLPARSAAEFHQDAAACIQRKHLKSFWNLVLKNLTFAFLCSVLGGSHGVKLQWGSPSRGLLGQMHQTLARNPQSGTWSVSP